MRVQMQSDFTSIQLGIVLNIIENRILINNLPSWRSVDVIVDMVIETIRKKL
ncbi:hypothetical protein D3C72_1010920 [compost metagenome]